MDNDNKRVFTVNFAKAEMPKLTINKRNNWVEIGVRNNFFLEIMKFADSSNLHGQILSSKVDSICGNGFVYDNPDDVKTTNFVEHPNKYESLITLTKKLAFDYVLFGGFALKVKWNKERTAIESIYHWPLEQLRCEEANEDDFVENYYFSKDWMQYRKTEFAPEPVPGFNEELKKVAPIQCMYTKNYFPGWQYYPRPEYFSAMSYVETAAEIANRHLSNAKNGMSPGYLISFVEGDMTPEEREATANQFNSEYNNSDASGKNIITFTKSAEDAPKIVPLAPSQLDKQYIQLQASTDQEVLSGHKITSPLLVGIPTPGALGNSNELETAFEIYESKVIKPAQDVILETLNKIGTINGCQELHIVSSSPIRFRWSQEILSKSLTQDEIREAAGYEPLQPTETVTETQENKTI